MPTPPPLPQPLPTTLPDCCYPPRVFTFYNHPAATTYYPWNIAKYGDKMFAGNAYSGAFGAYNGGVEITDLVTGATSSLGPPEALTYGGFGSNVTVIGSTLYVGAYGAASSAGRIYRFDASTLAYLGKYGDGDGSYMPAGGELGRPRTIVGDASLGTIFASHLVAFSAPGGILIWHNHTYVGEFLVTGAYEFGPILEMSPDHLKIAAPNKPTLGALAELVILEVNGPVLSEIQRIPNVDSSNNFGLRTGWDNDSLGFWVTTATGVTKHYRWNGSSFAATLESAGTARWVEQGSRTGGLLVTYSDRVELIENGTVTNTWSGLTSPSGWSIFTKLDSLGMFACMSGTGIAVGSEKPVGAI